MWHLRKSKGCRVTCVPPGQHALSGQNCVGFYFNSTKFSSPLRGVSGWLCLARLLGLCTHHGVKCCQGHSCVLTLMRGVEGSGPLGFPKDAHSATLFRALMQSRCRVRGVNGSGGSDATGCHKNFRNNDDWRLHGPLEFSCIALFDAQTKVGREGRFIIIIPLLLMRNLKLREAEECPRSHGSQMAEQGLNPTQLNASYICHLGWLFASTPLYILGC